MAKSYWNCVEREIECIRKVILLGMMPLEIIDNADEYLPRITTLEAVTKNLRQKGKMEEKNVQRK